jgi:hypothetical protein
MFRCPEDEVTKLLPKRPVLFLDKCVWTLWVQVLFVYLCSINVIITGQIFVPVNREENCFNTIPPAGRHVS